MELYHSSSISFARARHSGLSLQYLTALTTGPDFSTACDSMLEIIGSGRLSPQDSHGQETGLEKTIFSLLLSQCFQESLGGIQGTIVRGVARVEAPL